MIIIVILVLMLVIPLFNKDNYASSEAAWDFILLNQAQLLHDPTFSTESLESIWAKLPGLYRRRILVNPTGKTIQRISFLPKLRPKIPERR